MVERLKIKVMEITNEGSVQEYIIREPKGLDYASAMVLLRNLGEKENITSLEREALAIAVQLLQRYMETQ